MRWRILYNALEIEQIIIEERIRSSMMEIWRRKWQPTPVFWPRECCGQRSLVGCCPQGCTESDMTEATQHACMHWRRKWQPTPVFLPGESQGRRSLVDCRLWDRTESDTTEATQQQQQHDGNIAMIQMEERKLRLKSKENPVRTNSSKKANISIMSIPEEEGKRGRVYLQK